MVTAWKPIFAAIVIFVAGVLTGSFTIDLTTPQPARAFPRDFSADRHNQNNGQRPGSRVDGQLQWLMKRMQRDLNLSDKQTQKIQAAFKESRDEMKTAINELQPQMRASTEKLKDKLRGDLTEKQIEKFSKYLRPHNPRERFKGGSGKRPPSARGENRPRRGERYRDKRNTGQEKDSVIENSIN
ncbi:hypothetical protein OAM03_02540 [Verrucomicrobia bacterium]|nr:hypothetical protein [Verrucomicrobiota bacterium]